MNPSARCRLGLLAFAGLMLVALRPELAVAQSAPATDSEAKPEAPKTPAATAAQPAAPEAPPEQRATLPQPAPTAAPKSAPRSPFTGRLETRPPAVEPDIDYSQLPLGTRQQHFMLTAGARFGFVPSDGYDVFSKNNLLSQFSLGVGRTVFARDRLSAVAELFWDYGTRQAEARQEPTELFTHRFTAAAEGRYHLWYRWFAFVRLAPGAMLNKATLRNRLTGATLSSDAWAFAVDLTAGSAFEVAGPKDGADREGRFWVTAEGGYGFSSAVDLNFESDDDDPSAPARDAAESLGDLSLSGPLFRLALLATY